VERYVEAIARAAGPECVLVHPGVEQFERLGVRTIVVERPTVSGLVRILRRLRPNVAHVTDVWPQAVLAARLARVARVAVTHHTPGLPRRDNLAGRVWVRVGWALGPEVIYTSEADQRDDGRSPSHVVPLGIDVDRFSSSGTSALSHEGSLIGTVGRLVPQKDQRTLLAAVPMVLEHVPDASFVIVGDGPLRDELEQLARGLPVTFTGRRDDVPDLLASLDVFALPSLFEGLCLAVLEAQAAGVPVVATPVGGVRDTVVDGETGLLVPIGEPQALAAAIVRVLEDASLAKRLTAEARRRVRERYSERRMIDETLSFYGLRAEAISVSQPDG